MPKRVFVVDDSQTVRESVRISLEKFGYEIFEAEDGEEAISKLSTIDVDLLITDLHMPNLGGIELAGQVRKMSKKRFLPILMLTSDAEARTSNEGKSVSVSAWLNKSTDMHRLPKLVSMLIGS